MLVKSGVFFFAIASLLIGCGGGGVSTVLQDFGIQERPDDYVSGSDAVFTRLGEVGKSEMERMNAEGRLGEIRFDEDAAGSKGRFYKRVKMYERYYPLEAKATSRSSSEGRGYVGYIDYSYRIFESARSTNRTEAAAFLATIPTDERGRESYRYRFSGSGEWGGRAGERLNK